MSQQYFENSPHLEHEIKKYQTAIKEFDFEFITDSGVFSRSGLDYGSRVLLETVDFSRAGAGDILDVGCGYGPIGIVIAKNNPNRQVHLVDINERALNLARQNAELNKAANVKIYTSDGYKNVIKNDFAAIVTNPPIRAGKAVVHRFISEAINYLEISGSLTLVIQKKQGAPSAKKKMAEIFGNVTELERDKGYWILQSIKRENDAKGDY